jgi:DNA-binding NarL/FixJ family response regulator
MGSVDAPARPLRVFILDDHELVRRGLIDLLRTAPDTEIVGEAGNATDALHRIPAAAPDVALLDARLPDRNGIDVCREIRSTMPTVQCLILTSYDDDALFAAVMAGASGYLLKQVGGSDILAGIRIVGQGKSLIDSSLTGKLLTRLRNPPVTASEEEDPLSPREHEILELITEGFTNRQIGERLYLAEKTVKNYVSSILAKLSMERRTQAAVYGAKRRLEKPAPP